MKPLQTYYPFGPPIGYAELPKELVNDFNKGNIKEIGVVLEASNVQPFIPSGLLDTNG